MPEYELSSCPPTFPMHRAAPPHTSIDLLPPETLVEIFQQVTHEPIVPMQLALVCRNWRDVVLGASELWAHIEINIKDNLTEMKLTRQIELSLKASMMLDIHSVERA